MSCVKTFEPVEMQFGMLSRVGQENMYYMGHRSPAQEGALLGCLYD